MSRVPQSFLDQLLARVDLHDVVGQRVQLKKQGKDYGGLCPFHTEKSPSFTVSSAKQFYHCFGCGAHGTAINFLMEYDGIGFRDAVEQLAQSAGMSMPAEDLEPLVQSAAQRQAAQFIEWNGAAAKQFMKNLAKYPAAVGYLKQRGVIRETVLKFGLGYADGGLQDWFSDLPAQDLVACGLLVEHERRGRSMIEDKFRERVMFPIQNERGAVVGFGGRVLDGREPKYLNSAETALFHKGEELYGLVHAKAAIRKESKALVVEGYMDVVMLHQYGEERAVASLGTSLTESQARKLFRFADEILFCFDGDAAGQRAAARAAELILPFLVDGKQASFLLLPNKHDPDSYIQEVGLSAWQQFIATQARPLSEMLWAMISVNGRMNSPEGKTQLLLQASQLLATIGEAAINYKAALSALIAERVGQPVPAAKHRARARGEVADAAPDSEVVGIQPDAARLEFYENFALLCSLSVERAGAVPSEMMDDFAALISGWFAVAPAEHAERMTACSRLPGGPLRRLLMASLRRTAERKAQLGEQALVDESHAALTAIGRAADRASRSSQLLNLFM
jgi:DNA primase